MKKIFASSFTLLLLLLSLWGLSSWVLGEKNKQLYGFIIENDSSAFLNYEVISFERSIFTSKVKMRLQLNQNNNFAQLIGNSFIGSKNQTIDIKMFHGPILFDKSGIRLAKSVWKLNFGEHAKKLATKSGLKQLVSEEPEPELVKFNQVSKIDLLFNFDDQVEYTIPIKTSLSELNVTGYYNQKTEQHHGNMTGDEFVVNSPKHSFQVKNLNIDYRQFITQDNEKLEFEFHSKIPQLSYKNPSLKEDLSINVNYSGKASLANDGVNAISEIVLGVNKTDQQLYPIEKAVIQLSINDLNIKELVLVDEYLDKLNNVKQQSQWLLEEQGEYPEGQDQIWQTQDEALRLSKQLPSLVNKVLFTMNKSDLKKDYSKQSKHRNHTFKFMLKTFFQDEHSTLNGYISSDDMQLTEERMGDGNHSILSLVQAQANVKLDDGLFRYVSSRLPISKSEFKLSYKQNKLLMQ